MALTLTYKACKSVIDRKSYITVDEIQTKLDVFLLNNRITESEYRELTQQLNSDLV